MKPILAIDVDLTVVDSLTPWLNWFYNKTGIRITNNHMTQYDLVPVMRKEMSHRGINNLDPFSYWKDENLYDTMAPLPGCVELIENLVADLGADLAFVSHCVPEHEDSKRLFLGRHFPKHAFVSTSEKHLVNYEWLLDDNKRIIENGVKNRPQSKNIRFTQLIRGWDETIPPGAYQLNAWSREAIELLFEQFA